MNRIQYPLLKQDNAFHETSFETAFNLIADISKTAQENETLILTTGNYSNEELYLLQRLARTKLHTNAIASFDYYQRGTAFFADKNDIVPFSEFGAASLFVCAFDNSEKNAPLLFIRKKIDAYPDIPRYMLNSPDTLHITDYAAFFRALNYCIITHNWEKGIYINGLGKNYDAYRKNLLDDDYNDLLNRNNLMDNDIVDFLQMLLRTEAPVFLIWERFLSARAVIELENLCMLLDIQAKPASGFLCIKAEVNSQGLFDMGIFPNVCVGGRPFTSEVVRQMEEFYETTVHCQSIDIAQALQKNQFSHCILLNNNNIDIPKNVLQGIAACRFKVLQAGDMVQANLLFDLILPSSFPQEIAGTYIDFTKVPHSCQSLRHCPIQYDTFHQLEEIGKRLNLKSLNTSKEVFMEYISFFQSGCRSKERHFFR